MRDRVEAGRFLMWALVLTLLANAAVGAVVAVETRESNLILKARTDHIMRIERCACGEGK